MTMPAGPWAAGVRRAPGALGEVLVCLQVPAPFAAAMGRLFGPLLQGPPRPPPHALAGSGLPGRDARGVGGDGGAAGLPPLLECAHERSLLLFPGSLSTVVTGQGSLIARASVAAWCRRSASACAAAQYGVRVGDPASAAPCLTARHGGIGAAVTRRLTVGNARSARGAGAVGAAAARGGRGRARAAGGHGLPARARGRRARRVRQRRAGRADAAAVGHRAVLWAC